MITFGFCETPVEAVPSDETNVDSGAAEVAAPGAGLLPSNAPRQLHPSPLTWPHVQQVPRHSMAPTPPPQYRQPFTGLHPPYQAASFLQPRSPAQAHTAFMPWQQQPTHVHLQTGLPVRHAYSASQAPALSAPHVRGDQGFHQQPGTQSHEQRQMVSGEAQGRGRPPAEHEHSSQPNAPPQFQSMHAFSAAGGQAGNRGIALASPHVQANSQYSMGWQHQSRRMSDCQHLA